MTPLTTHWRISSYHVIQGWDNKLEVNLWLFRYCNDVPEPLTALHSNCILCTAIPPHSTEWLQSLMEFKMLQCPQHGRLNEIKLNKVS
jgi:hypothetical protein